MVAALAEARLVVAVAVYAKEASVVVAAAAAVAGKAPVFAFVDELVVAAASYEKEAAAASVAA